MATASAHARRRRHPATEAGLWLVWITARVTGLSGPLGAARRLARDLVDSDAAHRLYATCADVDQALRRVAHRALLRAELATADLLTGPVPELLDAAPQRLRRRAAWLTLVGGVLLNLLYLAVRP